MQLASDFEDFITWGLLVLYQVCLRCLGSQIEVFFYQVVEKGWKCSLYLSLSLEILRCMTKLFQQTATLTDLIRMSLKQQRVD